MHRYCVNEHPIGAVRYRSTKAVNFTCKVLMDCHFVISIKSFFLCIFHRSAGVVRYDDACHSYYDG